jgi:hypothetical protein
VVGFVDEDNRHRFFISAAYLSQGEVGFMSTINYIYRPMGFLMKAGFLPGATKSLPLILRFGRIGHSDL